MNVPIRIAAPERSIILTDGLLWPTIGNVLIAIPCFR